MKKKFAFILAALMIVSLLPTIALAQESVAPSEIVAIREDVSRAEALKDVTFDIAKSQESNTANIRTDGAYWSVWGERTSWVYDSATYQNKAKPIGHSAHKNATGSVLSTYHYTRTYINVLGSYRGDSKRVWGTYTVTATGGYCIEEVWNTGVHTVKYGTES